MTAPSDLRPRRPATPAARPAAAARAPRVPRAPRAARSLRGDIGALLGRLPAARRPSLDGERLRTSLAAAPWLGGIAAAVAAAAMGCLVALMPTLVVWMSTPDSGLTWWQTLRVSGLIWLVGQGTPVQIADASYSLAPWGLALVPLAFLVIASRVIARRARTRSSRLLPRVWQLLATAVAYGAVMGIVAVAASGDSGAASWPVACVLGVALALACCGSVAFTDVMGRLPALVLAGLRGAVVASCALVVAGAGAVAVSLVLHIDDAVSMGQGLQVGLLGSIGVLVVGLAYVPVIVVWAVAYLLGAGVVLGPQALISPFVATLTPVQLPALPLLAAIPQQASPYLQALPILAVGAGVLGGWQVARRLRASAWWARLAAAALLAGAVGIAWGVLSLLASGSLGNIRLAEVGPPAPVVAGLALLLVFVGAAPMATLGAARPVRPVIVPVPDRTSVVIVNPEQVPAVEVDPYADDPSDFDPDATIGMDPVVDPDPTVAMEPVADQAPESDAETTIVLEVVDVPVPPHD